MPDAPARSVPDLVAGWARRTPNRPAVVDRGRRLTWAELDTRVDAVGAALRVAGLAPGDRLAAQLPTGLDMVEVYLGAVRAGLVVVPVNPSYTLPELLVVLSDSGARALVTASAAALAVASPPGSLAGVDVVIAAESVAELSGADAAAVVRPGPIDPEATAVLIFTSGTSGRPKGAMLSHRALLANIEQGLAITPPPTSAEDVILVPIPLFHIYGLNAGLGIVLARGSTVVLVDHFDVAEVLNLVTDEGVTVLLGAPAMFAALSTAPDFARRLGGLRFAMSGSAALAPAIAARYRAAGIVLHEGYGLTEAAPVVTSNAVDRDGRSRIGRPSSGTVGAALPGVELELRDSSGGPAADGDPGLVAVRGANLFSGYWPDGAGGPDEDGWWETGDLGFLNDGGDLVLVGRDSDLVIVNGFNVYPGEVEAVLSAISGVAEAAVVGVPDESSGEAMIAFIVPRAGAELDSATVLAEAARSLARFKLPKSIDIVAALPHTITGKVQKWQLRDHLRDAAGGAEIGGAEAGGAEAEL